MVGAKRTERALVTLDSLMMCGTQHAFPAAGVAQNSSPRAPITGRMAVGSEVASGPRWKKQSPHMQIRGLFDCTANFGSSLHPPKTASTADSSSNRTDIPQVLVGAA